MKPLSDGASQHVVTDASKDVSKNAGQPFVSPTAPSARKPVAYPNVPSPNPGKPAQNYARFIPREELRNVTAWNPTALGGGDRRADERRNEDRGLPDRRAPGHSANSGNSAANAQTPSTPEWQARVTAARQAGYKDGYKDGTVALDGFKQSFSQQTTAQIGQLLKAFDEQLHTLDSDFANALARTAMQLAQQVVRVELQQQPQVVADVARQALTSLMHSARQITVHVHPADLPLVTEGAQDVLSARNARLQADPNVSRGGVHVRSDLGTVDARIETRWAQAQAALGVPDAAVPASAGSPAGLTGEAAASNTTKSPKPGAAAAAKFATPAARQIASGPGSLAADLATGASPAPNRDTDLKNDLKTDLDSDLDNNLNMNMAPRGDDINAAALDQTTAEAN